MIHVAMISIFWDYSLNVQTKKLPGFISLRYQLSHSDYLSLAGMALQVEFGDFSHDIHDDIYFNLEHYLPSHMIKDDIESLRSSLVKLHKAHLGKSKFIFAQKKAFR